MKKSFTLIELLIALVIIGVVATLAMPKFGVYTYNMHGTEAMNNLRALSDSAWNYYIEAKRFPFQADGPIPDVFDVKPPKDSQYWDYRYHCNLLGPNDYYVYIIADHKAPTSDFISPAPVGGIVTYYIEIGTRYTIDQPLGEGYYIRFSKMRKLYQPKGAQREDW